MGFGIMGIMCSGLRVEATTPLANAKVPPLAQPPPQSDIPSLCKLSWAVALVVFDLRLLAMCQSWLSWPCVIQLASWEVFGLSKEIDHWSFGDLACHLTI